MSFIDDIKYSIFTLLKNPKFSLMSIFLMTSGLGLFIYMQSFIYNTLEGPLPFDGGDRVRVVFTKQSNASGDRRTWLADYKDIKANQNSFDIMGFYLGNYANVSVGDRTMSERKFDVGADFFRVTGVEPIRGRVLNDEDTKANAEKVAVISESLWRDLYNGAENVIGDKIKANDDVFTVVGVMPNHFKFPDTARFWVPYIEPTGIETRNDSPKGVVFARLKEGVSDEQANRDVKQIMVDLDRQYPDQQQKRTVNVVTYQSNRAVFDQSTSNGIKIAVALVLLLACLNTGNLLLSRSFERAQDTAVRQAIGAPKATLIGQMMLDSVVICTISCILAIGVAHALMGLTYNTLVYDIQYVPYWWSFSLTSYGILQGVGVTILAILLTGLFPAYYAASRDPNEVLKAGTRGSQSKLSMVVNHVIVIGEIVISCAVLILTVAVVNTVHQRSSVDYGATIDNRLSSLIVLPYSTYNDNPEKQIAFYRTFKQKMEQYPEAEHVVFGRWLPIMSYFERNIELEGIDYGKDATLPYVDINFVTHGYFDNFDIELKDGRLFSQNDKLDTPKTAVVTERFVAQHFPNESVLGKRMKIDRQGDDWYTIIGVVNNVLHGDPIKRNIERASVFLSHDQDPQRSMWISVKTLKDPGRLKEAFQQVVHEVDPSVRAIFLMSLKEREKGTNNDTVFVGQLFILFAFMSVLLAFTGIYGVMSNTVVQQKLEIGVRRALGAHKLEMYQFFFIRAGKQLLVGLVAGVPVGIALVNMLSESEIATFSAALTSLVPLLIVGLILIAVILPLSRAMAVEPVDSLRDD